MTFGLDRKAVMKIREMAEAKVETFWGFRMWQKEQQQSTEIKHAVSENELEDPLSGAISEDEMTEEMKADREFLLETFFGPVTEDDQEIQDQYDEFYEDAYSIEYDDDFYDNDMLLSDTDIADVNQNKYEFRRPQKTNEGKRMKERLEKRREFLQNNLKEKKAP